MDDELEADEIGVVALGSQPAAEEYHILPIPDAAVRTRLDAYLASLDDLSLSRSYAQKLIDEGRVTVSGKQRAASWKLRRDEIVSLLLPPPAPSDLLAEQIPLNIVYEDSDVIVVDKPAGMVVHPAPGHARGTLVNALLGYDPTLEMNGTNRPGIIHRLDKDTSGLLVVARNDAARDSLLHQMQARTMLKQYLALVQGKLKHPQGIIDAPIDRNPRERKQMAVVMGGRPARTRYETISYFARYTYVRVRLETGRTHQIRVHMNYIGHSIVGDSVYGDQLWKRDREVASVGRQFLHAHRLGFNLPHSGEYREFASPLPTDLQQVLDNLS
ncbi:MAG: RluA family pseudouridine synthase [Candidatus Chloroheliales bacterium]|nr:MAG: RluA family pseudouridine synthase [Chloroflexota bacterium]